MTHLNILLDLNIQLYISILLLDNVYFFTVLGKMFIINKDKKNS